MADALGILQAALGTVSNSTAQAEHLKQLGASLEKNPLPLKVLAPVLLPKTTSTDEWLMRNWVFEVLLQATASKTSPLSIDDKVLLCSQAVEPLASLLSPRSGTAPEPAVLKSVIQIFTVAYPLLFGHLCLNRTNPQLWQSLSAAKSRILDMFSSPQTPAGVRISALKFAQRVLLVDTRGVIDPRLQNRLDPNLSMCPADHPFINAAQLEAEGHNILKEILTILYTNTNIEILSALLNSWVNLAKLRPSQIPVIVDILKQWQPSSLVSSSASEVRSIEKCLRVVLSFISRLPTSAPLVPQITETLQQQAVRMERAAENEKRRKAENRKRPLPASEATSTIAAKRPKLEGPPTADPTHVLASFDFTTLPAPLITELIIANLHHLSDATLAALVQAYRQSNALGVNGSSPTAPTIPPITLHQNDIPVASSSTPTPQPSVPPPPPPPVKVEPVDPLKMDIDQDEMEFEPEKLNDQLSGGGSLDTRSSPAGGPPSSSFPSPSSASAGNSTDPTVDSVDIASLANFRLPSPSTTLSESDRLALVIKAVERIHDNGADIRAATMMMTSSSALGGGGLEDDAMSAAGSGPSEMWVLLVIRMITRVVYPSDLGEDEDDESEEKVKNEEGGVEKGRTRMYERQDMMRQRLCEYIMQDFTGRIRFATAWMNEEWYNDQLRLRDKIPWRPNYEIWLSQIISGYQTLLEGKDRTFSRFLLDLPAVPTDVFDLLREFCVEIESSERMQIGFSTLRGFVSQRPALRNFSLQVLLELTTHSERRVRGAAINTVKIWVPHYQPMDWKIRSFAQQLLRKLQPGGSGGGGGSGPPKPDAVEQRLINGGVQEGSNAPNGATFAGGGGEGDMVVDGHGDGVLKAEAEINHAQPSPSLSSPKEEERQNDYDDNMEDGQITPEELIQTPYLPDRIHLPAQKQDVLQHVELLFALSVKAPDLLDDIFASYGGMDSSVQEAIQELITALVKSLGSSHGKLLTLLRMFPPGAESLALRIIKIFTSSGGRPSSQIVALVKGLVNERDLDARFLIPIIGEMDKSDILRHLPKIVSMLNGQVEARNLVKSVFGSIVAMPPQTFGSVSSNLPRMRQSELLTPVELMVLLHDSEKEIGVKSAIEAIGVCFSMTDVYRSEILAVVMQQIVDEPVLPVLFMRTVIQAVTTYKSLIGFVSTTLFSRLITKKIWTNNLLWEGFIRCAKAIAPASFGALLQLPKEQLRELVEKQPSLKVGLREFVSKKSANNKARVAGFMDIFGGDGHSQDQPQQQPPQPHLLLSPTPTPTPTPPLPAGAAVSPQAVTTPHSGESPTIDGSSVPGTPAPMAVDSAQPPVSKSPPVPEVAS